MGEQVAVEGLTVLIDPKDAVIDIVFVHGLYGHPRDTWCHKSRLTVVDTKSRDKSRLEEAFQGFYTPKRRLLEGPTKGNLFEGVESGKPSRGSYEEVFWPKDLLGPDFPRARIMTFGYRFNIEPHSDREGQATILSHATRLLNDVKELRQSSSNRDLAFVGHSFGGILIKELLRRSEDSSENDIRRIFQSTTAVLFFGTPHRASKDWTSLSEGVREIAMCLRPSDVDAALVSSILPMGSEFELCSKSFTTQRQKKGNRLTVRNFQESKKSSRVDGKDSEQLTVPSDSSALDPPDQLSQAIDADHIEMVRFSGRDDPAYNLVKKGIQTVVVRAQIGERNQETQITQPVADLLTPFDLSKIAKRHEWRELLLSTATPAAGLFERLSDYDHQRAYNWRRRRRLKNTTKWVLEQPDFQSWLHHVDTNCLWLSGTVGSGKSIVMSTIVEACIEKARHTGSAVLHFVFDHQFRRHLTAEALFGSLTKQLLVHMERQDRACPKNIVAQVLEFYGLNKRPPHAQEILDEVIMPLYETFKDTGVTILIDGIDECNRKEVSEVLNGLRQLIKLPLCKVAISCRESIGIARAIPGTTQIWINPKATAADMEIFIDHEIEQRQYDRPITNNQEVLQKIRQEMVTKADGMFLWVKYLLKMLWEECTGESSTDQMVYETLQRLPSDLNETYERCLDKVNHDEKRKTLANRVLKLLCVSVEPFTITQLQEALSLNHVTGEIGRHLIPKEELIQCCANLAYLEKDSAEELILLAHFSVRQFLFPTEDENPGGDFQVELALLGELCVSHLYRHIPITQLIKGGSSSRNHKTVTTQLHKGLALGLTSSLLPTLFRPFMPSPDSARSKSAPLQITMPIILKDEMTGNKGFLKYAEKNWIPSTTRLPATSSCWPKFRELALLNLSSWPIYPWDSRRYHSFDSHVFAIYAWAINNSHFPLLSIARGQRGKVKDDIFTLFPLFDSTGNNGILPLAGAVKTSDARFVEVVMEWVDKISDEQLAQAIQEAYTSDIPEMAELIFPKIRRIDDVAQAAWRLDFCKALAKLVSLGADRRLNSMKHGPNQKSRTMILPGGSVLVLTSPISLYSCKGKFLYTFPSEKTPRIATIASNGHDIAIPDGKYGLNIWCASTGAKRRSLPIDSAKISRLQLSSNGRRLASIVGDGHLCIWNMATGDREESASLSMPLVKLNWSASGQFLAIEDEDLCLLTWEPNTGLSNSWLYNDILKDVVTLAISPTETMMAVAKTNGLIAIVKIPSFELLHVFQGWRVKSLEFDCTGRRLAYLAPGGNIAIWNTETMQATVSDISFNGDHKFICSPNGKIFAVYRPAMPIILMDWDSGAMVRQWDYGWGWTAPAQFSSDGMILTVSDSCDTRFWFAGF